MSIYATLFHFGVYRFGEDRVTEVLAQGVPAHITHAGTGYEWVPPPVDPDRDTPRAVVIVEAGTPKGTERCNQEYQESLLILTGEEWERISFISLMDRIHAKLTEKYGRGPSAICFRPAGGRLRLYVEDGKVRREYDD